MKDLGAFFVYAFVLLGLGFGVMSTAQISAGVSITIVFSAFLIVIAISDARREIIKAIRDNK